MADEINAGGVKVQGFLPSDAEENANMQLTPGMQGSVSVVPLDLADLSSVHTLSHNLVQHKQRLDMVVCNAGVVRVCALYLHKG